MERSCSNCNNKSCQPCSFCTDMDKWEGDCSVCKNRTPHDPQRFCTMDAGDDGFNCCGDKLELIDALKS
jgi:hypothetical protein